MSFCLSTMNIIFFLNCTCILAKCFSLINFLSIPGSWTAENYEFTEQDVLFHSYFMAKYYGMHCYENNSKLCFIILYCAIYIPKIQSAPDIIWTYKFNKRHSVPVILIVIKMKLLPEDSYSVFSKIFCILWWISWGL